MSKKGLSLDEKKIRMVELFHETSDIYSLKELEKAAPKVKGITQQTVKEVLADVVGDHKVKTDKIGTGVYYWSFTSDQWVSIYQNCEKQVTDAEALRAKVEEVAEQCKLAENEREADATRESLYPRLQHLQKLKKEYEAEAKTHQNSDQAMLKLKQAYVTVAKTLAHQYCDGASATFDWACAMASAQGISDRSGMLQHWTSLDNEEALEIKE